MSMGELTYKGLLVEILDGNLVELRLHPNDMEAVESRVFWRNDTPPIMYRFMDDVGAFILFNGCKLRYDKNAVPRGWTPLEKLT